MYLSILSPSPLWQWIFGFIGVCALLMATYSIIHAIWGTPKIIWDFDTYQPGDGSIVYLCCLIFNAPITKGILKLLRVQRRMAQDVTASFEIREDGTNKPFYPPASAKIKTQQNTILERVSLPASIVPSSIAIACYKIGEPKVKIYEDKTPFKILPVGIYKVKLSILSEDVLYNAERCLVVQDKHPLAYWQ